MSDFRIDQITNQAGTAGPQIAGITTFSSTSGLLMPGGSSRYRYISESITTNGLALNYDTRYSYPGAGTIWYDLSIYGSNGTLTNGPTYSTDGGGSIVLDGSDDFINFGNHPLLYSAYNTQFTQEYIIKLTSGASSPRTIFRVDDWSRISTSISETKINFTIGYSSPTDTLEYYSNFFYDQWYIISVVWSKLNTQKIYLNGQLVAQRIPTVSNFSGIVGTAGGANLGRGHTVPFNNNLNGKISVFRHYTRVLTDEEILQNYNAVRGRFGL